MARGSRGRHHIVNKTFKNDLSLALFSKFITIKRAEPDFFFGRVADPDPHCFGKLDPGYAYAKGWIRICTEVKSQLEA
jgi:hypothetical protein